MPKLFELYNTGKWSADTIEVLRSDLRQLTTASAGHANSGVRVQYAEGEFILSDAFGRIAATSSIDALLCFLCAPDPRALLGPTFRATESVELSETHQYIESRITDTPLPHTPAQLKARQLAEAMAARRQEGVPTHGDSPVDPPVKYEADPIGEPWRQ